MDELITYVAETLETICYLMGIDLRKKARWNLEKERKGFYYYNSKENSYFIPLNRANLKVTDITNNLKEESFEDLKKQFKIDFKECNTSVGIFVNIVEDMLLSLDKNSWSLSFKTAKAELETDSD